MSRIALVIHRYGKDILGGAELLASEVAKILNKQHDVTVLTTTSADHLTWKNVYPPGVSSEDGVKIMRFDSTVEKGDYFHGLHSVYLDFLPADVFPDIPDEDMQIWSLYRRNIPHSFEEEMIKSQGPYPVELFDYLALHEDEYDRIIFFTYLYATAYFGIKAVKNKSKIYLYPTFHDEPLAYLSLWKEYKDVHLLFSTPEEQELAERLLGRIKGDVLGYGLEDKYGEFSGDRPDKGEYILYAGRIEHSKGIDTLLSFYEKYRAAGSASIEIKLIGRKGMELPSDLEGVSYLGFVSEEEKLSLMKNALALVIPSPNESLSIAALEALMMGTPILVNGHCTVLDGHIKRSEAGYAYFNDEDFINAMNSLTQIIGLRDSLGNNGRKYFLSGFEKKGYEQRILKAVGLYQE